MGGGGGRARATSTGSSATRSDARLYLPSSQPDFLTATKFINTLIGTGLTVHPRSPLPQAATYRRFVRA